VADCVQFSVTRGGIITLPCSSLTRSKVGTVLGISGLGRQRQIVTAFGV